MCCVTSTPGILAPPPPVSRTIVASATSSVRWYSGASPFVHAGVAMRLSVGSSARTLTVDGSTRQTRKATVSVNT